MEEAKRNARAFAASREAILRLLQAPRARPVAAVLVAVGVAEHDLLEATARREVRRVGRIREESGHHRLGAFEILDRLEERHHVERRMHGVARAAPESRFAVQQQHLEKIARCVGHADHGSADRRRISLDRRPHDLERREQFARRLACRRTAAEQRPVGREFPREDAAPRRLVERGVVAADSAGGKQFRHRRLVHAAVLADVERGQMQAERAGPDELVRDRAAVGDLAQSRRDQRAFKQFESRHQFGPGDRVGDEAFLEMPDPEAVGLVPELLRDVPERCDRLGQFRRNRQPPIRDAEIPVQPREAFPVPLDRRMPHAIEGESRGRRGHPWIAVAIAADPRAVADRRLQRRPHAVVGLDRVGEVARETRDGIPDRAGEMVDAAIDLVGDGEPRGADLVGDEKQREHAAHRALQFPPRRGTVAARVERLEARPDPMLLGDDAPPAALGRMGGQGGFDVEPLERREQILEGDAATLQFADRLGDRFGTRSGIAGRGLAVAIHPDDVDLLGLVAKVEPDREVPKQPANRLRRKVGEAFRGRAVGEHRRDRVPQRGEFVLRIGVRFDLGEASVEPVDVPGEHLEHGPMVAPGERTIARRLAA